MLLQELWGPVADSSHQFYIGGEGGASISLNSNFGPNAERGYNLHTWVTPSNRDWTNNFGIGGLGGVFLGYQYNPNLAFQFTYDYRGGYSLFFNSNWGYDPTLVQPYGQEYFSAQGISFQSFLFDMVLSPEVNWGGFVPYIKAGIGLSINAIGTTINSGTLYPTDTNMYLNGASTTSFAWDAGIGANYYFNDKFSIGLGYRFVDVGKLSTSNRFVDTVSNTASTIQPLQASNVFLNEVVASIAYHFDYM